MAKLAWNSPRGASLARPPEGREEVSKDDVVERRLVHLSAQLALPLDVVDALADLFPADLNPLVG